MKKSVAIVSALSAVPSVLAQETTALGGLATVGNLFTSIFDAMFSGISEPVWMKVVLWIISFTLLYMVFGIKKGNDPMFNKGSRTILSVAIALAMIAPLRNSFVEALFGSLGFVGLLFYIAPVVGLMYLTHKMTHETKSDKSVVQTTERHNYVTALIFWLIIWIPYINGVAAGTDINYIGFTSAILNLVAIWYVIYYIFKSVSPKESDAQIAEDTGKMAKQGAQAVANTVANAARSTVSIATQQLNEFRARHIKRIKELFANVVHAHTGLMLELGNSLTWNSLTTHEKSIKKQFLVLGNSLIELLHDQAIPKLLAPDVYNALKNDLEVMQSEANSFEDRPFNTTDPVEQQETIKKIKALFGKDQMLERRLQKFKHELKI